MSPITTHVLDTASGNPAAGVAVELAFIEPSGKATPLATGVTDADGRIGDLITADQFRPGVYRLVFASGDYFAGQQAESFHPEVVVSFRVAAGRDHYHVPLLISPYGYTTYRGS